MQDQLRDRQPAVRKQEGKEVRQNIAPLCRRMAAFLERGRRTIPNPEGHFFM
jgi:hypothetical protein